MVCTESGCANSLEGGQLPGHVCGRVRKDGERTDLDVESERSPVVEGNGIRLIWRAYGQTGPSTEYARDGRQD